MDHNTETIVALATPKGRGALAIVRLSGTNAIEIAAGLLGNHSSLVELEEHKIYLSHLLGSDGRVLDQAQFVIYRKPKSYTGENLVEYFLHGSPYVIDQVIQRCCQLGARPAEPGEFTLRAFLNGKIDLTQAEAVADLISASSKAAHQSALALQSGILAQKLQRMRNRLLEVIALVELQIDFSDQDLPVFNILEMTGVIHDIVNDLASLEQTYQQGRLAREGASVVISGKPNVGKSTLFNVLLGADRAIVHEQAGTTRDVIEGAVEWDGLGIRLFDTAGWDEAFTGPDQIAVERARQAMEHADIIVWVMDIGQPVFPAIHSDYMERTLIIANKSDVGEYHHIDNNILKISATRNTGLESLKRLILDRIGYKRDVIFEEGLITRHRHVEAVRNAQAALISSLQNLREPTREELAASDLKAASMALSEIIGEVTNDDVLNKIFSDFCVGK